MLLRCQVVFLNIKVNKMNEHIWQILDFQCIKGSQYLHTNCKLFSAEQVLGSKGCVRNWPRYHGQCDYFENLGNAW